MPSSEFVFVEWVKAGNEEWSLVYSNQILLRMFQKLGSPASCTTLSCARIGFLAASSALRNHQVIYNNSGFNLELTVDSCRQQDLRYWTLVLTATGWIQDHIPSVTEEMGPSSEAGSGAGFGEKNVLMPVGAAAGAGFTRCLIAHFRISFSFASTVMISTGMDICSTSSVT